MRRIGVALAVMVVVVLVWLTRRPDDSIRAASSREQKASTPASTAAHRVAEARSLANAHERRVVADQLAAAREERAARAVVTPPPSTQRREAEIDAVTAEVREALRSAMPRVRACYERALPDLGDPNVTVDVDLTLTGDPDIGTLIDADVQLDPKRRLPGTMVDCLRSELQLLELPPLAGGDRLTITYPFAFVRE